MIVRTQHTRHLCRYVFVSVFPLLRFDLFSVFSLYVHLPLEAVHLSLSLDYKLTNEALFLYTLYSQMVPAEVS